VKSNFLHLQAQKGADIAPRPKFTSLLKLILPLQINDISPEWAIYLTDLCRPLLSAPLIVESAMAPYSKVIDTTVEAGTFTSFNSDVYHRACMTDKMRFFYLNF